MRCLGSHWRAWLAMAMTTFVLSATSEVGAQGSARPSDTSSSKTVPGLILVSLPRLPEGVWKGTISCTGFELNATVTFNHPLDEPSSLRLEFVRSNGNAPASKGAISYRMTFTVRGSGGDVRLYSRQWREKPNGYTTIDPSGAFSADMASFDGHSGLTGCERMRLSRVGVPAIPPNPAITSVGTPSAPASPPRSVPYQEKQAGQVPLSAAVRSSARNLLNWNTERIGSLEIVYRLSGGCVTLSQLEIKSSNERFFANQGTELKPFVDGVLRDADAQCPRVQSIEIRGEADRRNVYVGDASRSDGWSLRTKRSPIDSALFDINRAPESVEGLAVVNSTMRKYASTIGGAGTPDWEVLRAQAEPIIARITEKGVVAFEKELAGYPVTPDGVAKLLDKSKRELGQIETIAPSNLARYRIAFETRLESIKAQLIASIDTEVGRPPAGWEGAVKTLQIARKRAEEWRVPLPEITNYAKSVGDTALGNLAAGVPAFIAELQNHGTDWPAMEHVQEQRTKLFRTAPGIPEVKPYLDAASQHRERVLTARLDSTRSEIGAAGKTLTDIEAVIDLGEAHAQKFRDASAADRVKDITAAVADRVAVLATSNLPDFRSSIAALPMTRASAEQLLDLLLDYAELELSVPAFVDYRQVLSARLGEVEQALCEDVQKKAGLSSTLATRKVVVEDEAVPLSEFVCAADKAGHGLTQFSAGWLGWLNDALTVQYTAPDGTRAAISLMPSKDAADANALIGTTITVGAEQKELARAEWIAFTNQVQIAPPSGKPDRSGVTECDRLAADPSDPRKVAPGIATDALNSERMVEACIAALEYDAGNPRLKFQLGRALYQAGADKDAIAYLDNAASQGYAAASALLGDIHFLDPATEKQALEHYKRAVSAGYQAVADKVAILSAPEIIDFSQGWPTKGVVKLSCFMDAELLDVHRNVVATYGVEFNLLIDLDTKSAKRVSGETTALFDRALLRLEQPYTLTDGGGEWQIAVEPVGKVDNRPILTLSKGPLALAHTQSVQLETILGIERYGRLNTQGECMQSLN